MSKTAQVGGTHYNSTEGQGHWDLMEEFDIGYLEANASKYVMRYDLKGTPVADLLKARSYIERLLESRDEARRVIYHERLQQFYVANNLAQIKRTFFDLVHLKGNGSYYALRRAVALIDRLVKANQT